MQTSPGLLCILSLFLHLPWVAAYTQTFWPPQIPLAVRSPYFSAWQPAPNGSALLDNWPTFWYNEAILGWQGFIRVDGQTYTWIGQDATATSANLSSFQVTPTRSIFNWVADTVDLTVTFLTPIEPSDWVRQSMPFTYVSLNASSNDGQDHTVEVYCDISAEWLSGNRSALVKWSTTTTNQLVFHQAEPQDPVSFTEIDQQAEDGTSYIAMLLESTVTYMTGPGATVRSTFVDSGELPDTADTGFRAISDDWPVFAIAYSLGSVTETTSSAVWAVGYVRNASIQLTVSSGETQLRYPYFVTEYLTAEEVIYAFLSDYDGALERSMALDDQLMGNATLISSNYSDLISTSARQAFGGIDITVSEGSDNTWNTSDVMIFMKDIGDLDLSRVNPVEVMYAAMPMFLYFNASYLGALLYPVMEYAASSLFSLQYAPRDIGETYPSPSGDNPSSYDQGVEQSGNMLIMALAHAKFSGDGTLIGRYYDTFKGWAEYLRNNTEDLQSQETADNQEAANMTNLALKGIIGLQAMAEISDAMGESSDAALYSNASSSYYAVWKSLGVSSNDDVYFTYSNTDSWTLLYNLYADRLLGTDIVSDTIINGQPSYYQSLLESGEGGPYGLPLNSDTSTDGNSAWLLFAAASASDSSIRDTLLNLVWARASLNTTTAVFPTAYDVSTGILISGQASPGQGAMFAPLALNLSTTSITIPPSASASATSSPNGNASTSNVGAIVGGVVGGVAGAVIVGLLGFVYWRRRQAHADFERENEEPVDDVPEVKPVPYLYCAVPTATSDDSSALLSQPSKLRRELQDQQPTTPTEMFNPYAPASPVVVGPYQSSTAGSGSGSGSGSSDLPPAELMQLRSEVDNLRRFVQEIQADRLEAPPSYFTEES